MLGTVTWLEGFGTVLDKTRRLEALFGLAHGRVAAVPNGLPAAVPAAPAMVDRGINVRFSSVLLDGQLARLNFGVLALHAMQTALWVVVPAALENVITDKNAGKLKVKAIIEMANGPVTPEADEILAKRGIPVIPDVLANSGGVTVSYFEWVQNLQGYYWSHAEVIDKLKPLMEDAFAQLWAIKEKHQVDGRMAAYLTAVRRVVDTMLLRGGL